MIEIRGSEASTFQRCRLKWKYQWVDGLKPKRPNGKLFFGTLFHKYLESYYMNDDFTALKDMTTLFDDTDTSRMEQVELDELWDMALTISQNYVRRWSDAKSMQNTIATELKFRIPYGDDLMYYGTIDRIYLDQDKRLWFTDYKTVASVEQYEDNAEMDRQISRYWWAVQQMTKGAIEYWNPNTEEWESRVWKLVQGKEVAGFVYDIIKKDMPHPPEVLKKGGLSKAKNQKTSFELYRQAIRDHGLDDRDYEDILVYLRDKPDPFFKRVEVFRTQGEVDASMEELLLVARDMHNPRIYRNITKDCSWDCDFKGLCQASMDGSNVDMLINLMFDREEVKNG